MKKAEEIQIGDIPYRYNIADGFKPLPPIKKIVSPVTSSYKYYIFYIDKHEKDWIDYKPNEVDGYYHEWSDPDEDIVIVPHSDKEIAFMEYIFRDAAKDAKTKLQESIKSLLNIN